MAAVSIGLVFAGCFAGSVQGGSSTTPDKPVSHGIALRDVPFKMLQIKPPVFPDRTVDIRDYGAVGNGKTLNTRSFADAIAACARAGGGRILVPAGTWLTGPIHLKSNINLHIEKDAEIRFSTNFKDYLPVVFTRYEGIECYNYSPPIYAKDCNNVAVTGPGKLDGQGRVWWLASNRQTAPKILNQLAYQAVPVKNRIFGSKSRFLRPSFIQFVNCKNVLIEGLTVGSGPMWTIHPLYCENVIVRNVTLVTRGHNNDGIDPDSCRNVLIEHCNFDTSDDAIAIKSGRDADGRRVGRPCENIIIRHCRFGLGKNCDGVISIGSEMSGDVRNVFIYDCSFDRTDRGVRIKSRRGRGGVVENIWIQNITLGRVKSDALLLTTFYESGYAPPTKTPPTFRNIHIKNLICRHTKQAIRITGLSEKPIEKVTLEDISISAEKGFACTNAEGIKLINVNISPEEGPVMQIKNSQDVIIQNSSCVKGTGTFLKLEGEKTKNIRLVDNNLSNARKDIVLDKDVPPDAVICNNDDDRCRDRTGN